MNNGKQNLAAAVRNARTELGLSQEKLAEILNIDSRTILSVCLAQTQIAQNPWKY